MLKTDRQNSAAISCLCFFALHYSVSAATLADESGVIRTQMGKTVDQKMLAVAWDTLYNTTV
jgi:hypothetical protein